MFTVMVGLEPSGKRSSVRPLASRYSVIPSTEVIFCGTGGLAALTAGLAALSAAMAGAASGAVRVRNKAAVSDAVWETIWRTTGTPSGLMLGRLYPGCACVHSLA